MKAKQDVPPNCPPNKILASEDISDELEVLENQSERLIQVLVAVEHQIARQTSLRQSFLRGALYGLGTVIGATILIAILGGAIVSTIESIKEIPFLGQFIDQSAVDRYLQERSQ
jgi:Domain of unknown function (DUF5665)